MEMSPKLKRFKAVVAEWTGPEFEIVTKAFEIDPEDEDGARSVAEDIAFLEGGELLDLLECQSEDT